MIHDLKETRNKLLFVFILFFSIMLLFETANELILHDLTRWQSNIITIIFTALTGTILVFVFLKKQQSQINKLTDEHFSELNDESNPHRIIRQLMQDKALFNIVFDTIPVGLWILDDQGKIIFVNESGKNLWGGARYVAPDEYNVYKAWFADSGKFIEADDWAAVRALRNGETSINEEIRIERFDGINRTVLNSALPLIDENKKIIGVLVLNQDITDKKKDEEELLKLSQAVENSPAVTAISSSEGTIVYVNTMFTKITGYEKEEVIGCNPRVLNSGRLPVEFFRDMWKTIKSGSSWYGEFLNRKKNGELYWEYASISPILGSNGKIKHFVKVGVDITLRKNAEYELYSTKERLEFLVSSSPVVIYTAKPSDKFEFTYISSNSRNIAGYSSEELTSANHLWFNKIHPDDRSMLIVDYSLHRDQEYFVYEYRVKMNDDKYYWFRDDAKILFDTQGKVVEIVGSLINIHERRIASEKLEYKLELEKLLNKISAGFVESSDINSAVYFALHTLADTIKADSCYLFEHNYEKQLLTCRYEWGRAGLEPLPGRLKSFSAQKGFEWWIGKMQLKECLMINSIADLPDEAAGIKEILLSQNLQSVLVVPLYCMGKFYGYISFNTVRNKHTWVEEDVNMIRTAGDFISRGLEKDKYEKILLENEERFRTLVENVGEGVGIVDENETFTFANPAAHKIFGVDKDELIGNNLKSFIPDDQFEQILSETEIRKRGRISEYEIEIKCPCGEKRSILVTSSPRFLEDGRYSGAFGVFRDITERKMLEKKLHETLQKEKELSELKSRFISTASHEFRTPLTTILTSADLLEMFGKKWPEQKYFEHISKIQNSVYNLTEIINDVLTISRVEKDNLEFNPDKTNIKQLCAEIINELSDANSSKIQLKYLPDAESVVIDKKLMKLVLKNLLSNSVKYSKKQDPVRFTVYIKNNHLYFAVCDKGIGIPEKDQSRLFEPFFRAENSNDMPGTGLGLSIVKHAVDKHNGKISFKSRLNKGTIFLVAIPFN